MHDPGAPPQRPQVGGAVADEDRIDSAPTAKTLRARAVLFDPHDGHLIFSPPSPLALIDLTSFSNFASQLLQAYS